MINQFLEETKIIIDNLDREEIQKMIDVLNDLKKIYGKDGYVTTFVRDRKKINEECFTLLKRIN